MEVADVLDLREGVERVPREVSRAGDEAVDFQAPIGVADRGLDAEVEDGKAVGELLAGREAVARRFGAGGDAEGLLFFGPLLFGGDVAFLRHGGGR